MCAAMHAWPAAHPSALCQRQLQLLHPMPPHDIQQHCRKCAHVSGLPGDCSAELEVCL